jgi:hypothetical protein
LWLKKSAAEAAPSLFYRALNGHGAVAVAHDSNGIMQL